MQPVINPLLQRLADLAEYNRENVKKNGVVPAGRIVRRCLKCRKDHRMVGAQRICSKCQQANGFVGPLAQGWLTYRIDTNHDMAGSEKAREE